MNGRFARNNADHGESPRRRLRLFAMNDRPRRESSSPVTAKCDVQTNPKNTTKIDGNGSLASRKGPLSPSKKAPFLPRTRDVPPTPLLVDPTGTSSPSSPRSVLLPPPPPPATVAAPHGGTKRQERTIASSAPASYGTSNRLAQRPGVSFQRNPPPTTIDATTNGNGHRVDPIAAKISAYGGGGTSNNANHHARGVQREPSVSVMRTMMDPIAAKIAAHDNHDDNNHGLNDRPTPTRSSTNDAVEPLPPHHHHNDQQQQYMEIAPGQRMRLRGAKETWQCVEDDAYLPTTCFSCDADLCCIMDASYVLCPLCRVVSPVEGWAGGPDGGVGLGFTYQDLAVWQREIVSGRQQQEEAMY